MSTIQGHKRDGSGSDAPDAKRQRLDDQENPPDPTKIEIKIEGYEESVILDRHTAMNNSLFFRAAMNGPWQNARTGIIVLEQSDYATPATVDFLRRYLEWHEYVLIHAGTGVDLPDDPLEELEDFGGLANFWIFADYLQSKTITDAIMDEFAERVDEMESLDEEMFKSWWKKLEHQPTWDVLRRVMIAIFVASDAFNDEDSRHDIMPRLPIAAQEAIVDELVRQHNDVHDELSSGADRLEEYVDDAGLEELHNIRALASKKVAAKDYYKSY